MENNQHRQDKIKNSAQGNTQNYQISAHLMENTICVNISNFINSNKYQGIYSFDNFSQKLKIAYETLQNIYELLEGVIKQDINKILLDQKGNFTLQYTGYNYKLKKIEIKQQILTTKLISNNQKNQNIASQVQDIKKDTICLKKDLIFVECRLERIQKIIGIKFLKELQQKAQIKKVAKNEKQFTKVQELTDSAQFSDQIQGNKLNFHLKNNVIKVQIENYQGNKFQAMIKDSDIPSYIAILYPSVNELYLEITHYFNQQDKQVSDKKFLIDNSFNFILQIQMERAGKKLKHQIIFKTSKVEQDRLQLICRQMQLMSKKQDDHCLHVQNQLKRNANQLSILQQKDREELYNLDNILCKKIKQLQTKLMTKNNQDLIRNIQQNLQNKLNQLRRIQQIDIDQLVNFSSVFTERVNQVQGKFKLEIQNLQKFVKTFNVQDASKQLNILPSKPLKIQEVPNPLNIKINQKIFKPQTSKYFDQNHPNFGSKFKLVNKNTITCINKLQKCIDGKNYYYHYTIMSPIAISETLTTYSYKVIKSKQNSIMFGLASQQLRNNKQSLFMNDDFIGYWGKLGGFVYDQKGKKTSVNKGGIRAGNTITVKINVKQLTVTWFKENKILCTSSISKRLGQKTIYPTIIMSNQGDTVEMNY